MKNSRWIVLLATAALAAALLPAVAAQVLSSSLTDASTTDISDLTSLIGPKPTQNLEGLKHTLSGDLEVELQQIGVTTPATQADNKVPAQDVNIQLRQLLKPLLKMRLPWTGPMTRILRKHLNSNMKASKRRMRRSSVPGDDTVAAAAATAAESGATAAAGSQDGTVSTCSIDPTPGQLVAGWASNSTNTFGTLTRIYNRIQLAYQDSRVSDDPYLNPDTVLTAAARRQKSNTTEMVPTTYVVISLSYGWQAVNSKCNEPPGCKSWGSKLYQNPDSIWRKDECAQLQCWEVAECLSSNGVCFMQITVLDWDPTLGYTSESSHTVKLVRDGKAPAVNGLHQQAAFAMCSPCTTQKCA